MIWAIKNNERIRATPKEKAICPLCNQKVISKCGNFILINTIHFGKKGCHSSAILRDRTAFIINQGGKING